MRAIQLGKPTGNSEEAAFKSGMLSGDTLLIMVFMSRARRDAKHAKARDFISKVGLSDVHGTPQNTEGDIT